MTPRNPTREVWDFLAPFLVRYDAAVFTLGGFVPPDFPVERVEIIPPAIDPQSPKNLELGSAAHEPRPRMDRRRHHASARHADLTLRSLERPSRRHRRLSARARRTCPTLQLALVGSMALDDPQGWDIYRQIQAATRDDPDIHVFTNLTGVGNIEVNAFQRRAAGRDPEIDPRGLRTRRLRVALEGHARGRRPSRRDPAPTPRRRRRLPRRFRRGVRATGRELLDDPDQRRELGEQGRTLVRERFLLTRLIADELRLYASVLGTTPRAVAGVLVGLSGNHRDPVCGMRVDPTRARHLDYDSRDFFFCSHSCEDEFARDPERFLRAAACRETVHPVTEQALHRFRLIDRTQLTRDVVCPLVDLVPVAVVPVSTAQRLEEQVPGERPMTPLDCARETMVATSA